MNRLLKSSYLLFIYIFFYTPIAIVIIFSFNDATRSLIWHGFTTKWYFELIHDTGLLVVAGHSLIIGILAASLATFIGTLVAACLFRYNFFGKQALHALIFILILTPEIVLGISLLILYTVLKIPLGFWSLLLAHTTLCIPFVTVTILGRVSSLDTDIFEAAKDLGASDTRIFFKIIIPLLLPAIAAGWLLGLTLSFDDVIISYFVTGPAFDILPLKIYSMVRLGVKPEVNALCTLLLAITLLIVISAQRVLRKKQ